MENEKIMKPMKKITGILDVLICLLLFISALYKGAFYKEDSLFISMVICMLGIVCLSVKLVLNIRDNRKIIKSKCGTIIDICVILMPIAYFLPVLFRRAASIENGIFEAIRYVNFAIIYFIARTSCNKKIYLTSLVVIGIIIACLGIDELTYRAIEQFLSRISINYLAEKSGKISSTLQYANITALIMLIASIIVQDKLAKNVPLMNKDSSLKFKVLVSIELFSLILLQSAIILTTSRMNTILVFATTIIYSIQYLKQGRKKSALMLVLMLVAAFALVTSIDEYLLVQDNFMICFTYIITLTLILGAILLGAKFSIPSKKESKRLIICNTKTIAIILTIFIVLVCVLLFTPDELRVNDNTNQGSVVVRNIYCNLQDNMDLDIKFKFNRNNKFVLELYEIDTNFNKKMLISITEKSVKDNTYSQKLNFSNTTENLMFTFSAIDSDITIEHLKLNGKKITLSYMFMPDTLMFRLKDTLIKDSNNNLRFTYYKDALKLFNMSKIFGIGGEGFKARYQEVQDESYISSEVHSSPLQILVESGMVGFAVFITLCITTFIIASKLLKNKHKEALLYILVLCTFVLTATFDLVFSFGIMINIFAVILGIIVGEYKRGSITLEDRYELDNKSIIGMLKIATLSISLMVLIIVTIYSVNIYRASMIIVPENKQDLETSYERVGALENKVVLDKYNLSYLNSLLAQYDSHIEMLHEVYLMAKTKDEKNILKTEINNYIVKQKEIADSTIEYEYYNKYALEKVARCYFKHYTSYANIYNQNFKNDDIAYVFYIGYGIKLTERLITIGTVNKLAYEFARNIYNEYIPIVEVQNNIIKSEMLSQAIEDMKQNLQELEEI